MSGDGDSPQNRVEELFQGAADLQGPERDAFLDSHCGEDPTLRKEVESLLAWAREGSDLTATALEPHRRMAAELSAELARAGHGPLESGDRLGAYQLLEELGQGGMSRVFLAERCDDQFQIRVAVKVLRPGLESADMLARLRQERQILASLNHPHIARLLDGGSTSAGAPFFVLEHIPGEPIDRYCDRRQLSVNACLELFQKVCGAVQFAHRNLIIHRDLKPSNLLVTSDGEPKLLDFGIAKLLDPESFPLTVSETRLGTRLLTPEYASPEQFQGRELTTGTDVYSLGMILYRLLTGRLPFPSEGQTLRAMERVVCEESPPLPSEVCAPAEEWDPGRRRQLRGDLDRILLKALAKDPEERYRSVESLAEDLRRYHQGLPVSVRRPSLPYRAQRFVLRHRTAFTAAALVSLLLVAVVVFYTVRLRSERDSARQLAERLTRTMAFVEEMIIQSNPSYTSAEEVTVREVVDQMAQRNEELRQEPALRAAVMHQVGRLYNRLALYGEAAEQLVPALEIRRQLFREEGGEARELEMAESSKELGNTYYYQGEVERSEPLIREAWQIRLRRLGADDPLTINSANDLAVALDDLGHHGEAEEGLREVLKSRELHDPPSVPETLSNLGSNQWAQGDLEEAETFYRQALELNRKLQGPLHRDVTTSSNNLAALLSSQGQHAAAAPLFAEALEANRQLFGEDHPYISRGLARLGGELRQLGRTAEAAERYREALEIHRRIAPEDPRIARWLVELAEILRQGGDCAAAVPLLEEALERSPGNAAAETAAARCR